MYIQNIFFIKALLLFFSTTLLYANISGIVFQDLPVNNNILNTYGIKDTNELGVKNIKVTAYPDNLSTLTDENGTWSLKTTQDSRIEFSNIPSYLQEGVHATIRNASVQFISNNTNSVTFALHNPADFSDTVNPFYVNNAQQNGTHIGSTIQGLYTVPYNSTNLSANYQTYNGIVGTGEIAQDTIVMEDIGSVWGKAYQKNKKRLFIASMLQRHIGFTKTPAEVYVTDYSAGNPANLLGSFSLQGKTPANGSPIIDLGTVDRTSSSDNTLEADPSQPNIDLDAYAKVGKVSYGGIDIDHATNTLWLINLNQKAIISIDVSGNFNTLSSATVNQYLLSNLNNFPTCTNGNLRPWALKVHEGKGYIGAVCDASNSQSSSDLSAYILSLNLSDPTQGLTVELSFQLDYPRQVSNWKAWRDTYFDPTHPTVIDGVIYAQPILSDIEFDKHNNIYLSFFDRYATQIGSANYRAISGTTEFESAYEYGEILKFCNNNGIFSKEGTSTCLQANYNTSNIPEFFNDQGGDRNQEASLGSLAILKGSNQLLLTMLDPHPESSSGETNETYWFTQGTHTLSLTNGSIENWYATIYTGQVGLTGKANGIGDIELITNPAPIEVGDRIWLDSNTNGIQDANESGISNVKINLVCNGVSVATSTTDSNGNYIFSNDSSTSLNSTVSYQYNITSLIENTNNCYLSIPNITGSNQQSSLTNYILTSANIGEGNNSKLNDSNAEVNGTSAKILIRAFDIPLSGANNHSFDIGFKLSSSVINTYTLGSRLWIDTNRNGIQDNNESGYNGVTVTLYDTDDCSGAILATTTTANDGQYQFSDVSEGTHCIAFTNLPSDHNVTIQNQGNDDTIDSDANAQGQITNINLTANDNTQGIGIFDTTITPISNFVQIGNLVWIENDNDGNASTGEITGLGGIVITATATATNGTQYSSVTDNNGNYLISVPQNDTYIIQVTPPTGYTATVNSDDNSINDSSSENNLSHDLNGTTVIINSSNNLSVDFGLRLENVVLGTTTCDEMTLRDDIQAANESIAITTIDVLANDTGSKLNQVIKFLSLAEGKNLWENQGTTITSVTTLDTLNVANEGTWTVVNNKVVFTALQSFDGQIPTPIYYIVEGGTDCTDITRYTNVAKVTINTACTCPSYETKSIAAYNMLSILLLIFMTYIIGHLATKKEL